MLLSVHKQPFITAESRVIAAHFVYHCAVFYALRQLYLTSVQRITMLYFCEQYLSWKKCNYWCIVWSKNYENMLSGGHLILQRYTD